ncbi:ion channel [Chitinibacteraceae bacterium HSL-7]
MMLDLLLITCAIFAVNLTVLAGGMVLFSRQVNRWHLVDGILPRLRAMYVVFLFLLLMSLTQIATWAGLFVLIGEMPDFETSFYFSTVNFATLGYGDMVLSQGWRLLGPLEAINGSLMLGLFASVMLTALQKILSKPPA